jgi:hippurate hydrolase
MLVGAARLLAERRGELRGSVKFLFQPGEEGFAGARVLIGEGLLDATPRVDAAFAIHVNPTLPVGQVALRQGALLAAGDVFSIELEGRGGHASQPHQTLDPIPVACEIVTALQALVTRRMHAFDPVVLSVTKIASGSTHNIIPDTAQIIGTIRTVSPHSRERVHDKMEKLVQGIASAHELEGKLHVVRGYPVTQNDEGFTGFVRDTVSRLLGEDAVIDMDVPIMGSEDFSYILERVPGAMVFLGAQGAEPHPHPLHSNRMVLDEDAMASGIALHGAVALRYLAG